MYNATREGVGYNIFSSIVRKVCIKTYNLKNIYKFKKDGRTGTRASFRPHKQTKNRLMHTKIQSNTTIIRNDTFDLNKSIFLQKIIIFMRMNKNHFFIIDFLFDKNNC